MGWVGRSVSRSLTGDIPGAIEDSVEVAADLIRLVAVPVPDRTPALASSSASSVALLLLVRSSSCNRRRRRRRRRCKGGGRCGLREVVGVVEELGGLHEAAGVDDGVVQPVPRVPTARAEIVLPIHSLIHPFVHSFVRSFVVVF